MYWVFMAGAEWIYARFMDWLVYSFIIFYCIICILLITICSILILLAVLQCVNKETIYWIGPALIDCTKITILVVYN